MHSDIKIFDGHCDTLDLLHKNDSIFECPTEFNIKKALSYKSFIQVCAIWIDRKIHSPYRRTLEKIEIFNQNSHLFNHIKSKDDFGRDNKVSLILAIEGGDALEGNENNLTEFCNLGVRLITLTWNHANEISDTAEEPSENPGLSDFGFKVVKKMNELGMVIDVSHISEKGFWDVYETSVKPFVASHSNSKALCSHPRNLTNRQFDAIVKSGGVAGINYYPQFLGGNDPDLIFKHIEHFLSLGGENNIGLGSDFDGIPEKPDGINGAESHYIIADYLLKKNLPEDVINKILFDNFKRVFLENLK